MLQSTALDILKSGHNVFMTGSAGSGKSHTLKKYIEYLEENKVKDSCVAITASTGIAATHIGGCTIHSWSCIGIKDELTDKALLDLLSYRKPRVESMKAAKVLVIEEISMLHLKQLNLVNRIMQFVRGSILPFGGIQVVVLGDFFQLPPVVKNLTQEKDRERFCFMSDSWVSAKFKVCYLSEQHRNGAGELNSILNAIRACEVNDSHFEILNSCKPRASVRDILHLHTHNANIDLVNLNKLRELTGDLYSFQAEKFGNEKVLKFLADSVLAPENLELKIGAKVMFVKNSIEDGYANGTQGVVVKFVKDEILGLVPVVKIMSGEEIVVEQAEWTFEENAKVIASIKQLPLRLAWAITIHKSQGMTLDEAVIDLGNTFELAQGYVALSRLRDLKGLHLQGIKWDALKLNPLAIKADTRFQELSKISEAELASQSVKEIEKNHKMFLKHLKK